MSKENIYYEDGKCTLIKELEQKCMYGEKYVFCADCTRRNIAAAHEEENELEYEGFDRYIQEECSYHADIDDEE